MDVRFDDVAALQKLVGDEYGAFGATMQVTQAMIDAFAEVTQDRQWVHVDVARCQLESPLGATIAHGYLLLALLPALADGSGLNIHGFKQAINYGVEQVRFLSPVKAGSIVHVRRRISHARRKGVGGSQLTFDTELSVVDAQKPAMSCRCITVFLP